MQKRLMLQLRKHEGRAAQGRRTGEELRFPVIGLLAGLVCCGIGGAAAEDVASFKTLRLEGNGVHWQLAAKGQRRVLSYWVVHQELEIVCARHWGYQDDV